MNIKIFFTTALCAISIIYGKQDYLPPLQIENIISEPVRKFIEKKDNTKFLSVTSKNSRDILGRSKKSLTRSQNYVIIPEETLEVDVAYLDEHNPVTNYSSRYEIKNGIRSYWFNEKRISEEDFLKKTVSMLDTSYRELGFRAKLTTKEIKDLINGPRKVFIQEAYEITDNYSVDYNIIFSLSEINLAHNNFHGGYGIGVYFDEKGCPESHNRTSNFHPVNGCSLGEKYHPTGVLTVLQKTAPEATIYGYENYNETPNPFDFSTWITIGSHSWSHNIDSVYSPTDAKFDNHVYNYLVAHFFAAGNQSFYNGDHSVTAPSTAFNVISVGAVSPTNGAYAHYSRWENNSLGNQKPEVGNYGEFIFPNAYPFTDNDNHTWSGEFKQTSAATPYTAAMAAVLMSEHPILKWHPEILKAVFLASEKTPITNASTYDQDNTTAAAKGISTYSSLSGTRIRNWFGNNPCCFNSNNIITFTETEIQQNKHYRAAISWLTSGTYIASNHRISQDIDLRIYQNGQLLAYSISSENSFEVVDFTTSSNADLTIEILRYANSGSDIVALGYSFWEDN